MNMRNKALKRYCREVQKWLPCDIKMKNKILSEIESRIKCYLEENPEADYQQIRYRFGTPKDIGISYVNEMSSEKLLDDLRSKRKIKRIIACVAAAGIAVWLTAVGAALVNEFYQADGYYEIAVSVDG